MTLYLCQSLWTCLYLNVPHSPFACILLYSIAVYSLSPILCCVSLSPLFSPSIVSSLSLSYLALPLSLALSLALFRAYFVSFALSFYGLSLFLSTPLSAPSASIHITAHLFISANGVGKKELK